MPESYNILTDEDMAILRRFIEAEQKKIRRPVDRTKPETPTAAGTVYVAAPPLCVCVCVCVCKRERKSIWCELK